MSKIQYEDEEKILKFQNTILSETHYDVICNCPFLDLGDKFKALMEDPNCKSTHPYNKDNSTCASIICERKQANFYYKKLVELENALQIEYQQGNWPERRAIRNALKTTDLIKE